MIRLGISRTEISPQKGIYLAGYGDRSGGGDSVRDELTATATVFQSGESRAAIVFLDLLGLNEEVCRRMERAIKRRLKLNGLLFCCSHTHSGPISWAPESLSPLSRLTEILYRLLALPAGRRQCSGWSANKRYIDSLVVKISDLVVEASTKVCEIELFAGSAPLLLGVNRRETTSAGEVIIGKNPSGPAPERIAVVQARRKADGEPVLTIANYDCHAVFLGPLSYSVSADWPGEMRRIVENKIPGLCVYMQGGCGNINPVSMDHDEQKMEVALSEAGKLAADSVFQALNTLESLEGDDIVCRGTETQIAVEKGRGYKAGLSRFGGIPALLVDPVLHFRYPWKTVIVQNGSKDVSTPAYLGFFRIGGVSIGSLSMEPFFETAEKVRDILPGFPLFAGYTNGLTGYLPTSDAMELGGYEAEVSPYLYRLPGRFEFRADDKIRTDFETLIRAEGGDKPVAEVRGMRTSDEDAVVGICHRTFFGGPDFPSSELIGYRWAIWYVRNSSEFSFVAADRADRAVGYILCAPDTSAYLKGYREEIVPSIRRLLGQLKKENPGVYRKYRKYFMSISDEYYLPFFRKIIREYPAHLHVDILPDYQKAGLGGRLMKALIEKLSAENIEGVHLNVGCGNTNAVGYYERFGFKIIKTCKIGNRCFHVMGLKFQRRSD